MKKAIFPGSFDPFTLGHHSIVKRTLSFMDEVIVGIGVNEGKRSLIPVEKRVDMIRRLYADERRVKVEAYSGLTVDFAREQAAEFIIRGIRTVKDFEYEEGIADINRKLTGIETIFLFTEPELASVSSSVVRELLHYGKDVSMFLPEGMEL
jgi:pantetheine-phosphate adenylyltransferase